MRSIPLRFFPNFTEMFFKLSPKILRTLAGIPQLEIAESDPATTSYPGVARADSGSTFFV
jgi:hypothetical protein